VDEQVAAVMEDVERQRAEVRRLRGHIQEIVQETLQLSGVGGLFAKLTGKYDKQVDEAEATVAVLGEELAIHQAGLEEAEARLAAARQAAEARRREAEAAAAERAENATGDPVTDLAQAVDGADAARRLGDIHELEQMLRRLRRSAERLMERATVASRRNDRFRSSSRNLMSQVVNTARAVHHDHTLGTLGEQWHEDVKDAEALADKLGFFLALPRVTEGGLGAGTLHKALSGTAHPDSAGARQAARYTGLRSFAAGLEECVPELDGLLEQLREGHRELRRTFPGAAKTAMQDRHGVTAGPAAPEGGGAPGAGAGDGLAAWLDGWDELFEVIGRLDRMAGPQTRTSELLGPMVQYNRTAESLRALAEAHDLSPAPPMNQGADLHTFIDQLRDQLPAWRAEVDARR